MSNKVNFDTATKSFSEIMGNGKKYTVPKYQRDYSWEEEQWDDLWQDIWAIHEQSPEEREQHYMGYLVLQREDVNEFKIIDGQQRLTTLSLLILATLQVLINSEDEQDTQRIDLIKSNYISTKSPSSLTESYKLALNRNNDEYYRNDLANLSLNPRKRNIKATEHKMRKAKEFYERAIKNLNFDGEQLGKFIESVISHHLLFTVITVGDDVNAYKVFETLNARGVQLSTPDLVKNHLFSIIDPSFENTQDIQRQEEHWSITLDSLGKEDFTKFLRCFWNSRHSMASKANLFKKIKTAHVTAESAIELLSGLKETSPIYAALKTHTDEQWDDVPNQSNKEAIKNCLVALDVFNMTQPYPVLLSAYFSYLPEDFAKICKWMHVFCIRYQAICGLPSNDVEKFYNQIAMDIYAKQPIRSMKEKLQSRLPSDDDFRSKFASKTLPIAQSTKKVYYLLASIENHLKLANPIPLQGSYSIEHILPKGASEDDAYWREQFGNQLEQYVYRLGNLTLLPEKSNRDSDKLPFSEKVEIYRKSGLELVQKLCKYKHWNPDSVSDYQSFLADQAVNLWTLN